MLLCTSSDGKYHLQQAIIHTESAARDFFSNRNHRSSSLCCRLRSISLPFFPCPLHRDIASYNSSRQTTTCLCNGLVRNYLITSSQPRMILRTYALSLWHISIRYPKTPSSPSPSPSFLQSDPLNHSRSAVAPPHTSPSTTSVLLFFDGLLLRARQPTSAASYIVLSFQIRSIEDQKDRFLLNSV